MNSTAPWWDRGACRTAGLPLDTWLPGYRGRSGWNPRQQAQIAACVAVCAVCPVLGECNADAMATEGEVAIRAGRTYEDRHDMAVGTMRRHTGTSRRRPISHGTHSGFQTHKRRNEDPCDDCVLAHRDYVAERKRIRQAESAVLEPYTDRNKETHR